jgi:capsid protein
MATELSRPNFLERSIAAVLPGYAVSRAIARERLNYFGWDGARRTEKRGSSGGVGKNASSESSRMTRDRITLMWEARDLERNMPLMTCALDRLAQYVCPMLSYKPRTEDPEIDYAYQIYFEDWMEHQCDITGRHDLQMLIELALRAAARDGDFAFNNVEDGEFLRLQSIESDRIGDPTRAIAVMNREDYVHGINLDPVGRPLTYEIYKRSKDAQYALEDNFDAKQITFLFNPFRSDQYRGVSWLGPIIPMARDLYEAFSFERGAIKWAASKAGIIKSADARLGASGGRGADGWDGSSRTADDRKAVKVVPNELVSLRPNEDMVPFPASARPSGAFIEYIDASIRDMAMGLNVPFGFFDMRAFNGVTSRLEVQQCQRTFQRWQRLLISKVLNDIRDRVLSWGIYMKKIQPSPNWNCGVWRFGAHITADVGYETQSDLERYLHGLTTGEDLAAKYGEDFEDMTDRRAKELLYYYRKSVETGMPMELLAPSLMPNATELLAQVNAAADAETPPEPTLSTMGDKAVAQITEIQTAVAQGQLPREEAIAALISVWQMDPAVAESIIPEEGVIEPPEPEGADGGEPPKDKE